MSIVIHKYGGTSVGSTSRIRNVANRIYKWHSAGYQMVIVTSAMSGDTNRLLNLTSEIDIYANNRELDMLLSTGEQISTSLLSIALKKYGINSKSYASWQIPIYTDSVHNKARINFIDKFKIYKSLNRGFVVIITGFQGLEKNGSITTLGRGGSDTSAVAIAAALNAKECLIFTDVNGLYVNDPRIYSNSNYINSISFEKMIEMSSSGTKILQTRSVEFSGKYIIPTRVLSSLTNPLISVSKEINSGTLINFEEEKTMEDSILSGISVKHDEFMINLLFIPDEFNILYSILNHLYNKNICIDMISQNIYFENKKILSFTVVKNEFQKSMNILYFNLLKKNKNIDILVYKNISKISIIGIGAKSHAEIINLIFFHLSKNKINIKIINTSEIKISILINNKDLEKAIFLLNKIFYLNSKFRKFL